MGNRSNRNANRGQRSAQRGGKFYFAWLEDPEYGASFFSYDSQSQSSNLRKEEQGKLNVHMQYTVAVG